MQRPTTGDFQYNLSNGTWYNAADRREEFVQKAARFASIPVAQVEAMLAAGKTVRFGTNWSDEIRLQPAPARRPIRPPPTYRFTCRKCGEHRDTTIRGHCDDCDA